MSVKLEKNVAWESSIRGTLHRQLFVHRKPIPPTVKLTGHTAIITGANGGLGFEAARQLLQLGLSHLVVAVRSPTKGETAALKLRSEFPEAQVDVETMDLADYDTIFAFAKSCQRLKRIDYAILNAGMQSTKFERNSKTGHEVVFQTNYLSTVLLMILLVSVMKEKRPPGQEGRPPVLTVVGSDTMYFSKFQTSGSIFSLMDDSSRFKTFGRYSDTKLLIMMFVARFAEKIDPKDIIINVCNPGMTAGTGLGQNADKPGLAARYIGPIFGKALGRSVEVGASVYIHALVMLGQESHGSFVSDWTIQP